MKIIQWLLDGAENVTTRLRLVRLTFRILQLKRALGLRYER